jgi:hypothetical protein
MLEGLNLTKSFAHIAPHRRRQDLESLYDAVRINQEASPCLDARILQINPVNGADLCRLAIGEALPEDKPL